MDSYIIETHLLTKSFGSIMAVKEMDLNIAYGETFGLIGPNGSGKTTLIRMLAGLLRPSSGQAIVLRKPVPYRGVLSQLGYMSQAEALYPDLTVRENITFFGRVYGSFSLDRLKSLLELLGLKDRVDSLVLTLSGGLRRRVSLACALMHQPRLLLLDEPTVGIDPPLRLQFWRYFGELNQQGVTILVSSHSMEEAERCHRLGLMREGQLLAQGTPQELKDRTGQATLEGAFLSLVEKP